jgi:DNA topoisomerase-1
MRTDCQKYSRVFLDKCAAYVTGEFGEKYVGAFEPIELVDASMPHEAIRVTNLALKQFTNPDHLLVRLYGLIWRNTVESCMAAAKYNVTEASIVAPLSACYKYIVETPVFLGWRRQEIKDSMTDTQAADSGLLFYLEQIAAKKDPIVSWTLIESKVAMDSRAPSHYTEASLIQKLEDLGIGRPSTFANLVSTIIDRNYVDKSDSAGTQLDIRKWLIKMPSQWPPQEQKLKQTIGKESNKLQVTALGRTVAEFLYKHYVQCCSKSC